MGLEWMLTAWLVVFGLMVGSFLNVVIARVPEGLSVVRPRSRCPHCGHSLPWYENIPVFSWIALRGRCSGCKAPISIRYPLIELLTSLLFLACLQRFGWGYALVPALVLVSLLVALTFIDAEHWILPLGITVPGTLVGVLLSLPFGVEAFRIAVIGALLAFLALRAMEFLGWLLFRKEAMGAGDKFLFALIGAFLGPFSLLGVIFLASAQGATFGLLRLASTGRAGPVPEEATPGPQEAEPTLTWAFLQPGLSPLRRLWLLPYSLLWQPIPDDPVDIEGEEIPWSPGPTNLPFGPWLALGALEMMLLGPWFASVLPRHLGILVGAPS